MLMKMFPLVVRDVTQDEIDLICQIDVTEHGDSTYKWIDGEMQEGPETWDRPPRRLEEWEKNAASIKAGLKSGGLAVGAFDGDQLVGFVFLRYRLLNQIAQLEALWVSKAYRRRGVATSLVTRALVAARAHGAQWVYVSACPSPSACRFYMRQGFSPSVWVHREQYDKEPEDIHMMLQLTWDASPAFPWMQMQSTGGPT